MQLESFQRPIIGLAVITLLVAAAPAGADGKALAKTLVGDLGITEDQAIGGTRALLDVARNNLGDDEFSKLLDGNADLDGIAKGDGKKSVKGAAKTLKGGAQKKGKKGKKGGLALLADDPNLLKQFNDLGMDAGMIERFAGSLLDAVGGGGPGSGLGSPKTKLLRKGLGI